jgi:SAM-dependent methyltransferase
MATDATNANAEATEAWDGPLFERFDKFRYLIINGPLAHELKALELYPLPVGGGVLEIGCGLGNTTARIAGLIGPDGHVTGVDVSPRMIESCRAEVAVPNASFEVRDVQFDELGGPYDGVFSRFGTMFFANPGAAMRNVRKSMAPGSRLVMVVWRVREDNPWIYDAQVVVENMIGRPEEYTDPTCGPGPFSMAGADTVSDILIGAGFTDVTLTRCDAPFLMGRDLDEAVEVVMALGPAGELVRLWGDRQAHRREDIDAALHKALARYETADGVWGTASTWIVSAISPGS